jgi:signal transduction histidine kinase/CheY-like chemotaxis protein
LLQSTAGVPRRVTFDVYASADVGRGPLAHSPRPSTHAAAYEQRAFLNVAGREWLMVIKSADSVGAIVPAAARNTLFVGLLFSLMLFAITRIQIGAWETAKQHENALRASDRAKDDFLAAVSHELRTPLNAILGWMRLLRSGAVTDDRRDHALEVIDRNARLQAQLVEDLLDVSRILLDKVTLALEPMTMSLVVTSVVESLRPTAEVAGVTLQTPAVLGAGVIRGDSARVHQIVWNLLSNAIKFTPAGGHVCVELVDTGSGVELRVRDTGIGIAPEFLPHVFERFRQAETSNTRARAGLGLGLAITRHLVELHGGSIEARSDGHQRGAIFVVWFPAVAAQPAVAEWQPPSAAQSLHRLRVLVVDDDADARELLAAALGATGARVATAGSADEAMRELGRHGADVLVSDIRMPGEDGISLLRRVRSLPGSRSRIPAIAVSASAREQDRAEAIEAGYQLHFPKPVDLACLQAGVAQVAAHAAHNPDTRVH